MSAGTDRARELLAVRLTELPAGGDLDNVLIEYRDVLRHLLDETQAKPRMDGSIGVSGLLPDGGAILSHDDLAVVINALDLAATFNRRPIEAVAYDGLRNRLGDDRV